MILAEQIDAEKIRLEASVVVKLKRVFANMAQDAETLYRRNGRVPEELALNYYPEFLKEVRDAMRKTIKTFGFELRTNIEEKHGLFFDAEFKKTLIDLELKATIKVQDENVDEKLEEINSEFFAAATLFVANQSESQVEFITATNAKELTLAAQQEEILFANEVSRLQNEINQLAAEQSAVREKIARANRQLAQLNQNSKAIIAKNIKQNLIERSQARSELIASQNVGMTEAWVRQTEAELIQDAGLVGVNKQSIRITKTWVARLDSKTRETHVQADGQTVGVNEFFNVGGSKALYPRDPNLPASESINCRCVSQNSVVTGAKSFNEIEIKDVNLKPTEEMARVAKRALEWRNEYQRGGTPVGVARARDISNRAILSKETVGRMVSFFARHRNNRAEFHELRDGVPTTWRIAWDLWGGDAGDVWSKNKWDQLNRE